ncbi:hypothetical protein Taro_009687, partial [Colocasia esculenta]|nr:hypothetical protein [Colocasia esculenta]
MSLRSGSWVRKSQTVDDVPDPSSQDSVTRHHSVSAQALVPTTQGASSTAFASSYVAKTPSWGRGTSRRGPSRGATERRIEPEHKWNVRVIGGYDICEQGTNFIRSVGVTSRELCIRC